MVQLQIGAFAGLWRLGNISFLDAMLHDLFALCCHLALRCDVVSGYCDVMYLEVMSWGVKLHVVIRYQVVYCNVV